MSAKSKRVINLQIHWVPGHLDFAPNDKADELAKEAAAGNSSPPNALPTFLRKPREFIRTMARVKVANPTLLDPALEVLPTLPPPRWYR